MQCSAALRVSLLATRESTEKGLDQLKGMSCCSIAPCILGLAGVMDTDGPVLSFSQKAGEHLTKSQKI